MEGENELATKGVELHCPRSSHRPHAASEHDVWLFRIETSHQGSPASTYLSASEKSAVAGAL